MSKSSLSFSMYLRVFVALKNFEMKYLINIRDSDYGNDQCVGEVAYLNLTQDHCL